MSEQSKYILIVDDDAEVRMLIAEMVKMLGLPTRQAANGRQALEQMRDYPPAAIILDLMMPVMSGFQLLAVLRQSAGGQDIPIIVLSALGDHKRTVEMLTHHVQGILVKGDFNVMQLREALVKTGLVNED